jgi:glycoprotein endo-alpha-1,2-mannosidase
LRRPTRFIVLLVVGLISACASNSAFQPPTLSPAQTIPAVVASETARTATIPTIVEGSGASYKVAAFYYPWYGNPDTDGKWIHWAQNNHLPPDDIGADYYPALGTYSSNDPAVVAQHMEWLRQAGIGVIITSWWGPGSREDQVVPLLLQTAEGFGIKVAFHIEPYNGRTAERLVSDIRYLYETYGSSPAFFRSAATSRYSPDPEPKGMFFVWRIGTKGAEGERVEAEYWKEAMDAIHALPDGALIIANTTKGSWVTDGHIDGLYNYATLHLEESGGFDWARSLPPESLYVPSVIPGFSAKRVGYAETSYVPREHGNTFQSQWTSALGTGVEPALVTITSFNEWHEGSMIEPPQFGRRGGNGYSYEDFDSLPPEGYLALTREWVETYLTMSWPSTYRARVVVTTTSDWTTLKLVSGGAWIGPELVSASPSALTVGMEAGDRLVLTQSLDDANAGTRVEMTWDVSLTDLEASQDLMLQIDRGNIGKTQVTILNYLGETPIEVKRFEWDQVTGDRNSHQITVPSALLMGPDPQGGKP